MAENRVPDMYLRLKARHPHLFAAAEAVGARTSPTRAPCEEFCTRRDAPLFTIHGRLRRYQRDICSIATNEATEPTSNTV
jgi:hypothetical protein